MMKVVKNWRSAWRWYSMHALAAVAVLPLVWMELPPDVKALIPAEWKPWIFSAIGAAGVLARLKDQGGGRG